MLNGRQSIIQSFNDQVVANISTDVLWTIAIILELFYFKIIYTA